MRNSSNQNIVFGLLTAAVLLFICLFAFQGTLPQIIDYLIKFGQSGNTALPSEADLVSFGEEKEVGDLAITVLGVRRPADDLVQGAQNFDALSDGEEYIMVSMKIRCLSAQTACPLNEIDFGIQSAMAEAYPPQHPGNYPEVDGLIKGGSINPQDTISGGMLFTIPRADGNLLLFYPRSSDDISARAWFILKD
jgi:hypothetical protein